MLGLAEDKEGRARKGAGAAGGSKVAAAGRFPPGGGAGRKGREERNMISLIMEGKFLQIEPVKYLQLARLLFLFYFSRGEC